MGLLAQQAARSPARQHALARAFGASLHPRQGFDGQAIQGRLERRWSVKGAQKIAMEFTKFYKFFDILKQGLIYPRIKYLLLGTSLRA